MNNSIELNFENFYVELIFDWFRDTVFKSTIEKFWYLYQYSIVHPFYNLKNFNMYDMI